MTLTVQASGGGNLRYQWYHGTTLLTGQTSATLTLGGTFDALARDFFRRKRVPRTKGLCDHRTHLDEVDGLIDLIDGFFARQSARHIISHPIALRAKTIAHSPPCHRRSPDQVRGSGDPPSHTPPPLSSPDSFRRPIVMRVQTSLRRLK